MKPAWPLVCACLLFLSVAIWCLKNVIKQASRNELPNYNDESAGTALNLVLIVVLLGGALTLGLAAAHRIFYM